MADPTDPDKLNPSVSEEATKMLSDPDLRAEFSADRPLPKTPATPVLESVVTASGINLGPFVVDQPLSNRFPVPGSVTNTVMDADRDISRGRLESALDLTLAAQSDEPSCIGLYVRQAELLLATGRHDSATAIINTINRTRDALGGPPVEVETERILTHADPSDENVLKLARTTLKAKRNALIDRYLPIAVDTASLQDDPSLALDLARTWLEVRPDNLDAAFSVTRESLRLGDLDRAGEILNGLPEATRDARGLVVKLALECSRNSVKQWDMTASLLSLMDARQVEVSQVQSLLREIIGVQPANESLLVHSGVLEVNAGNPQEAHQILGSIRPADPVAYYVAAVASARAAFACGDTTAAAGSLNRAMGLHSKADITAFASSCALLRPPHDLFTIGKAVAGALHQRGDISESASLLEQLTQLNPQREDLSRAYADALAKSGQRDVAIARLEEMLRKHERAGDSEGVLLTIQSILQIAPGNLRLRGRLIDEFMKRGMLQEAVQERWTQAQILERAGRVPDALDQLRRASEMASVLGDWRKLENVIHLMVRMQPDDLDARHFAATKFIEFGQIAPAIQQLWSVVDVATRTNEPDEAIAALHQIIALGPQEFDAYHKLGEVLAAVGEYAQAERVYRRLATLSPDDPAIHAKQSALAAMARSGQ